MPTCITDIKEIVSDAQTVIADIKNQDITGAITEVKTMFTAIKQAESDCAQAVQATMGVKDLQKCVTDIEKLVTDAEQAYTDIKAGDTSKIIGDITTLVGDAQSLESDCTSSRVSRVWAALPIKQRVGDQATCVKDLEEIFTDAKTLVTDIKNQDY
jgi:hypothetical protein